MTTNNPPTTSSEPRPPARDPDQTTDRPRRARRTRRRGWIKWLGIAILAAVLALAMWPRPLPVETAPAKRGALTVTVLEEGQTRVRHRYLITPPVAGSLQRVTLRAGDPVVAGETVLALLRPQPPGFIDARSRREMRARVEAAEAVLQHRRADLEAVEARLDLARADFARAERLHRDGSIPEQQWQTAANQVRVLEIEQRAAGFAEQVAAHELEQARATLSTPPDDAGQPEPPREHDSDRYPYHDQQDGAGAADQTADETADVEGEGDAPALWPIVSPIDGVVLNIVEENARVVSPDMTIMEIGDPRDLEAEIELLSIDAVRVRPGADVEIVHWGGDGTLRGRVSAVEPGGFTKVSALGVEEQRVRVRVDLIGLDRDDAGARLGDRYRVEGRIVTWHEDDVLQVPVGALFRRGNRWLVFVVRDGRVVETEVGIGQQDGRHAQVLDGLEEDDRVVMHPPDSLEDGMRVRDASE